MKQADVLAIFEQYGVLQRGHFKLSSGRHSDSYLQKQRIFEYPRATRLLARAIVERFEPGSFNVVASPAVGAILLGAAVADEADVRFVFAERADGAMTLRRAQHLDPGDKVLVVEDIVTTGASAREVAELVRALGAELAGIAVLADRSAAVEPPLEMEALLRVDAEDWDPAECPLCAEGQPLDAPGSRHITDDA